MLFVIGRHTVAIVEPSKTHWDSGKWSFFILLSDYREEQRAEDMLVLVHVNRTHNLQLLHLSSRARFRSASVGVGCGA